MAIQVNEKTPVASGPAAGDNEEKKPLSVRDSIKAAWLEQEEKEEEEVEEKDDKDTSDDDVSEDKIEEKTEEADKEQKTRKKDEASDEDDGLKASKEDKGEEVSEEVKDKQPAQKAKAPSSLPREVADSWNIIPSNVQQYITRTQKELSDSKAELGRKVAQYRDMDQIISHYEPAIRQYGTTPAQTVGRLFQWMDALAGPHKVVAFQQLAESFGVDLSSLSGHQDQDIDPRDTNQEYNQQVVYQTDPQLVQTVQQMQQHLQQQSQREQQSREANAEMTINNWAGLSRDENGIVFYKNKPHFEKVRALMVSLLNSGTIPLIDGKLDLDTAYERACYASPEIRAEIERDSNLRKAREAKEKQKREKEAAEKARSKGISIKPTAPSITNGSQSKKPNGPISVRDSIRSAIAEASNN